jgi:molybdopterin molybdotransferase
VVHHVSMIPTQRLPASLTPLEVAVAALLDGLTPVVPVALPLSEALGSIAADTPAPAAVPATDVAISDGWAVRARDLVGASSYSPAPLPASPVWVEAGDALPEGCDCVIDSDLLVQDGPTVQVLADAIPGQGVRRIGGDIAQGHPIIVPGERIRPLDLLLARAAGLERLKLRRPRLRLVDIPAISGAIATARLIAESARDCGADVVEARASGRDAEAIAKVIDTGVCDLLVTIGGSGTGRTDAVIAALASRGEVVAHGIALQPGRTSATGRIGKISFVALPGAPDQALAAWWTLVLPLLDQLAGRLPRPKVTLPLLRKVASQPGLAEIVLLERTDGAWMPSAVGDLSLEAIARADAWLTVPGSSEGFAAGTPVDAYMLRN